MKDYCEALVDAANNRNYKYLAEQADSDMCDRFKRWHEYMYKGFLKNSTSEAFREFGYNTTREGRKALRKTMKIVYGAESIDEFSQLSGHDIVKRFLAARFWSLPPSPIGLRVLSCWEEAEDGFCIIQHAYPKEGTINYVWPKCDVMLFRKHKSGWKTLLNGGLPILMAPIYPGEFSEAKYYFGCY